MLSLSAEVFDGIIKGTTSTWYSAEQFNAGIGEAFMYAVQACTTGVAGTSPTLTLVAQQSSDNLDWVTIGTLVAAQPITEGGALVGSVGLLDNVLAFGRLRATLGGTNAACRLRLYVAGRDTPQSALIYNETIFDESIAGTATTWKTPARFNEMLGRAAMIGVSASPENVTGTANLTVTAEHSADGQNWVSGVSVFNNVSIASGDVLSARLGPFVPVLLHYVRFSVSLAGSSPQCRLKIAAVGRDI